MINLSRTKRILPVSRFYSRTSDTHSIMFVCGFVARKLKIVIIKKAPYASTSNRFQVYISRFVAYTGDATKLNEKNSIF